MKFPAAIVGQVPTQIWLQHPLLASGIHTHAIYIDIHTQMNSKRVKESLRVVHICNSIRVQGHHRESEASLNPPLYTQKREKSTNYRATSSALFLNLENKYRDIYVSCISYYSFKNTNRIFYQKLMFFLTFQSNIKNNTKHL